MRRAAHIDENQPAIVAALETAGASVLSLAAVGNGCPDLLVCYDRTLFLIEVKNPAQDPNKRRLNDRQKAFHQRWRGPIHIIETAEDALAILQNTPAKDGI